MRTKSSEAPINVELPLISNSGVGKSSLIRRLLDEKFLPEDEAGAIVGADLKVHKMRMSRNIKLNMWVCHTISQSSITTSSAWLTIHPPGLGRNETVSYINFYLLS